MSAPRAGWYRDPRNPQNARWWDGERWTPHTRPTTKSADDDASDDADTSSPWWRALWVPAAVAGLGLGVAAGVGLGGSTTTAAPGPTVTATVTAIATVPGPTVTAISPIGGTQPANQATATGAHQAAASPGSFGRGLYIVGTDIQPGRYRTAGGAGCYWARLSSLSTTSIIDNSASSSPQTVVIQPSDQAFQVLGNCTFSAG
jgi:hypothetical protein